VYRILQVAPFRPDREAHGGTPVLVRNLARFLTSQKGCAVTVLAPDLERKTCTFRAETLDWEGCQLRLYASWLRYRASSVNGGAIRDCLSLPPRHDILLIHGYRTFMGLLAGLSACSTGTPYVLIPHGGCPNMFRSHVKKWLYDVGLGRRLLRSAQRVVFNSNLDMRQSWRNAAGARVCVIPHALPEVPQVLPPLDVHGAYGLPQGARLLLSLGRILANKNLEHTIDALQFLPPDTYLLVVGEVEEPRYVEGLKRRAARLGVGGRVRFGGPIYGDRKFALMRACDVFVSTSLYESFGLAIAESLALGVPTVLPTTAGIAEFVSSFPIAFTTELDPRKVAETVHRALAAGKVDSEKSPTDSLSLPAVLDQYWELIEETIKCSMSRAAARAASASAKAADPS
jgi:glycosyltransferase involved in cell wall biosynthesis